MKQANAVLKLSKDHEVFIHGITPIEAMLLTAEHHKNAGGVPLIIDKDSIKEIVEVGHDGKPLLKDGKPVSRSTDDEMRRLRGKYDAKKVGAINQIRDLPTEFDKALELGVGIAIPSGKLGEFKVL